MTSEKQNSLLNAMVADLLSLRRQSFRRGHYGNRKKTSGCSCGFTVRQVKSVSIPGSKWKLHVLVAEELSHLCIPGAGLPFSVVVHPILVL